VQRRELAAIHLDHVAPERVEGGIGLAQDRVASAHEMQHDRRRHGHLRRALSDGLEEGQVLREDRPGPPDRLVDDELFDRDRFAPLVLVEEVPLLGRQAAGSHGLPEEVDDITLAAKLAVADRLQPGGLLQRHHFADRLVFDPPERLALDQALATLFTRFDQVRRAQEAADLVGAEGGSVRGGH
jgi:hypothetical protein